MGQRPQRRIEVRIADRRLRIDRHQRPRVPVHQQILVLGIPVHRANVIGTPNDPHNIGPGALYLDPNAYAQPGPFTFGNAGNGIVRGPGLTRMDLSLGKKFYITEHRWFEIRGEAFNFSNTPAFQSPASQTITSTLFGQIRSSQGERNVELAAKFYF